MSGLALGLVIFAFMLALMVVRIPIALAMFIAGASGYLYQMQWDPSPLLNSLKSTAYARLSNYDLLVIPLFLMMGITSRS